MWCSIWSHDFIMSYVNGLACTVIHFCIWLLYERKQYSAVAKSASQERNTSVNLKITC